MILELPWRCHSLLPSHPSVTDIVTPFRAWADWSGVRCHWQSANRQIVITSSHHWSEGTRRSPYYKSTTCLLDCSSVHQTLTQPKEQSLSKFTSNKSSIKASKLILCQLGNSIGSHALHRRTPDGGIDVDRSSIGQLNSVTSQIKSSDMQTSSRGLACEEWR